MCAVTVRHLRSLVVAGLVGISLLLAPQASAVVLVDDVPQTGWQVNGTVYATVIVGDTVVVGGTFTQAVSPTAQRVDRQNLAAFSLSTGALLTTWQADADGKVQALATDGSSVYVGGLFTHVGGLGRNRMAKLDAVTGGVVDGFAPNVGSGVRAIRVSPVGIYIAGGFGAVNNAPHSRVALLDPVTGAPSASFKASADLAVYSIALSLSGTLYLGGLFENVDTQPRLGVAGVNGLTGALVGPAFDHTDVPVYGLDLSPDGTQLFGAQKSNQGSAWQTSTGVRSWRVGTDGNVQSVKYFNGSVYFGFHDGYQGDTTIKALAVNPANGAVDPTFKPSIDSFYGVHAIDATSDALVLGGAFKVVSGVAARGFAIFRP
jgi:hypothetical protein